MRPLGRPLFTSRGVRVKVARGSMLYSLEIHPLPRLRMNCGTDLLHRSGANYAGIADFDQNRSFSRINEIGNDVDRTHLVRRAIIRTKEHTKILAAGEEAFSLQHSAFGIQQYASTVSVSVESIMCRHPEASCSFASEGAGESKGPYNRYDSDFVTASTIIRRGVSIRNQVFARVGSFDSGYAFASRRPALRMTKRDDLKH